MKNDFVVEGTRFKWLRYSNMDELKKKYFVHHVNFFITQYINYDTYTVFFGINCESTDDISSFAGGTIYFLHDLNEAQEETKHIYKVEYTIYLNSGVIKLFKKADNDTKLKYINRGYPFLLFKDSKDYARFKINS